MTSGERNKRSARRAGVFPLVLIVTAAAGTAALTGLAMRSAADSRSKLNNELVEARLAARSGIEAALELIAETDSWRDKLGGGYTYNLTLGDAKATVSITDPSDSDLADSDSDPFKVTSTGSAGGATATLEGTAALAPADPFRERALSLNPVAFWPLDETTGTSSASPVVGSQSGGYSSSAVSGLTTGPDGEPAPLFTSLSQLAYVPHYDDLLIDDGALVFHASIGKTSSGTHTLLAKDVEGDNGPGSIHIYMNGLSRVLSIRMENSNSTVTLVTGTLSESTWHQITVLFGSDGLCAYVDGKRRAQRKSFKTGLGPGAGGSGNTHPLTFGAWYTGSKWVNSLNGSIRDVVFYNRTLSDTEITYLATDPGVGDTFTIEPDAWAWVVD